MTAKNERMKFPLFHGTAQNFALFVFFAAKNKVESRNFQIYNCENPGATLRAVAVFAF